MTDDQDSAHRGAAQARDADPLPPETLALHVVGVEVGHEVTHTLNYLRFLVGHQAASAVTSDLVAYASQEIERLERLLGRLRQFKLPTLALADIAVRPCIEQGFSSIRQDCLVAGVSVVIDAPSLLRAYADAACLAMALRCLAQHAAGSAPPGTTITVAAMAGELSSAGGVLVEVIDHGPPLPDAGQDTPFDVWRIQPTDSQAARRAFAHRLVRNLGGALAYQRAGDSNVFRLTLAPAREVP